MSAVEKEMEEGGGENEVKHRLSSTEGQTQLSSLGDDDENEYDNLEPQGNDAAAPVPTDPTDPVVEKIDSGEEEGEIDDDDDEEVDSMKTEEVVGDAAKAWLKKADEAKKKELLGFGYKIRPDLDEKFRPGDVQAIIEKIVRDHLTGQVYDPEDTPKTAKLMTDEIQAKIKGQMYQRYKLVTYVILGERRGEGVSAATRCIWDSEADCMATHTFLNETIFCCATVYGIYYY